jgi:hypothetical protein
MSNEYKEVKVSIYEDEEGVWLAIENVIKGKRLYLPLKGIVALIRKYLKDESPSYII